MKADGVASIPAARRTNLKPEPRREFLKLLGFAAAGSAAVLSHPLSLSASEADDWNLARVDAQQGLILASIARLLFPHPELNDSVYIQVVQDIDADMGQRPDLAKLLQVNDPLIVRDMVVTGCGLCFAPRIYCEAGLADGTLVQMYAECRIHQESSLSLLFPGHRLLPLKARVFIDFLKGVCGHQPASVSTA